MVDIDAFTTSPTALLLGNASPQEKVTETMKGGEENDVEEERNKGVILQKQFFWDQFLVYISSIIALLTALDVALQFFRGGGLVCRVPSEIPLQEDNVTSQLTREPTRDEVTYINTFCQQSLSLAELYPLFVLIQGLLIAAPQYLWATIFGGQFDFFFGLVRQLDRLRSNETGEYRPPNFEIVTKLEKQFPQKWKIVSIFSFYVIKLFLQLAIVFVAIIFNAAVFQEQHFSFSFKCPRDFDPSSLPKGWWLPFTVDCVYSSFRLHLRLQNINYCLLCLALIATVYGLVWSFKRHTNVLGYKEIALFAFTSCIRPDDYVHENIWKSLFKPRVLNDLDFLLMRLYRADSGYGHVFKDIQVIM